MNEARIQELHKFYHDTLFNDVLPFWLKSDLIDKEYGGFITSVDRQGKSYNDDKSVWFQGRCLWTFSKLCNVYGVNEEWASAADSGAKFIREHCIDTDGRMFFTVTREGKPLRKRRYFFSESFLVVGFAEYYLLRKKEEDLALAVKYFDFMWDMYCNPDSDPFKITPKENAEVRSLHSNTNPMVLVSSAQTLRRITGNTEYYDKIIAKIISDMMTLHYKEELKCVLENVGPDGEARLEFSEGRVINPGHTIEGVWFLLEYAKKTHDMELLARCEEVFDWAIESGWDDEYGGLFYFIDAKGCPPESYEHDMKLWWPHNETLIATLMLYRDTGKESYLDTFYKVYDYCMEHFNDAEYGEWFGYLRRDGKPTMPPCKGSTFKGPFHVPRMLVYVDKLIEEILADK
jgi:N-acylglucosamine 2-epimerase